MRPFWRADQRGCSTRIRLPLPGAWRPLAGLDPAPGRRGNTWGITVLRAVDTTGSGPLTVHHGDSDDPGFRAPPDHLARLCGRASPPFEATLRESPTGAGGGLCPV